MKNLDWDEKTLLEFEYTDDGGLLGPGWVIKQSKVAAGKFLGFSDDKNVDET